MRSIHCRIGTRIDGVTAALALAVDDFFVGEHGAQRRAPVDGHLGEIGETALVELAEDPLGPAHVAGVGGVDLPGPVVIGAERGQLALEGLDVAPGRLARVGARLDRILLGRQPEGVPAHRVQDAEAAHPLVAGDDVGRDVALGVADVEPRTRRVREHVEHVVLGLRRIELTAKGRVLPPMGLPAGLDRLRVVRHGPSR